MAPWLRYRTSRCGVTSTHARASDTPSPALVRNGIRKARRRNRLGESSGSSAGFACALPHLRCSRTGGRAVSHMRDHLDPVEHAQSLDDDRLRGACIVPCLLNRVAPSLVPVLSCCYGRVELAAGTSVVRVRTTAIVSRCMGDPQRSKGLDTDRVLLDVRSLTRLHISASFELHR